MDVNASVLLIDDDRHFARDLHALLSSRTGFVWVSRSDLGLAAIRNLSPSCILLDLDLPRSFSTLDEDEGIELLRRLTVEERSRVVIVTHSLAEEARAQLAELGAPAVYIKSESTASLVERVGERLERAAR